MRQLRLELHIWLRCGTDSVPEYVFKKNNENIKNLHSVQQTDLCHTGGTDNQN